MSLSVQEIEHEILNLPVNEQVKLVNFVELLRIKIASKQAVSPIYLEFEQAGLIGCIETDEQLSTTYKEKIDFSFKYHTKQ